MRNLVDITSPPVATQGGVSRARPFDEAAGRAAHATTCRNLVSPDDLAAVAALEIEIWGYVDRIDAVPASLLAASRRGGGVLIGAFDGDRLIGFAYSFPIVTRGHMSQWSHRLGVLEPYRGTGVGHRLKVLQRQRTLELGLDLIEWSFDPMQAVNAHFNLVKLGAIARTYEVDMYGNSSSILHRDNPTDRFVAEWWIHDPHVSAQCEERASTLLEPEDAPVINRTVLSRSWLHCDEIDLSCSAEVLRVRIPTGFTDMLLRNPALALRWRLATRSIFVACFGAGYRAVRFTFDEDCAAGCYLLTRGAL